MRNESNLIYDQPSQSASTATAKSTASETPGQWAGRNAIRSASTIGESVLGLPGDIAQGINSLAQMIPEEAKNLKGNMGTGVEPLMANLLPMITQGISNVLPTQESLHERTKSLAPEGYLEPKNDYEKFVNDNIGDFAGALTSFALTGGAGAIVPRVLKTTAKSVLGGNVAKKGAEYAGLGDFGQALAKFGGGILGGAWGNRAEVAQQAEQNYTKFEELAQGQRVSAEQTEALANKYLKRTEGSASEANKKIYDWAHNLVNKISEGKIGAVDAKQYAEDINGALRSGEIKGKTAQEALGKLRDSLYNDPMQNLKKINPNAFNAWDTARQDYAALNSGWGASKFIKDYLPVDQFEKLAPFTKTILKNVLGYAATGTTATSAYLYPMATASIGGGIAAAGIGAHEMSRAARLFIKSPTSKKLFGDVLKDISAGNSYKFIKDIGRFNKSVEHFEKSNDNESGLIFD